MSPAATEPNSGPDPTQHGSDDASTALASLAEQIVRELVRDPRRREEQLGEVFVACDAVARANPGYPAPHTFSRPD